MAEERNKDTTAPAEDKGALKKEKEKKQKGKKRLLLFLLLMALPASLAGLHLSGTWDARPVVFSLAPKLPYVGDKLVELLAIPPIYTMTVEERRIFELRQWEDLLDRREILLDELSARLGLISSDLLERGQAIAKAEEALASKENELPDKELSQSEQELFDRIVRTYQEISARRAAKIVENLSPELAVRILRALPEDEGANILGRMDAPKAAWLTEQLAKKER